MLVAWLPQRRWLALAVVLSGAFVVYLDIFIVNVAIPSLRHDLGAGEAQAQWVLAATSSPTPSRSSAAAGSATRSAPPHLPARRRRLHARLRPLRRRAERRGADRRPRLQGLAARAAVPAGAVDRPGQAFPPAERPRAFAAMGAVIGVATIAGQLVGGALIALDPAGLGWRAVFLVNLPLGLAAIVAARRLVPESRAPEARQLDVGGVALATRHAAAAPDRAAGGPRGRLAGVGVGRAGLPSPRSAPPSSPGSGASRPPARRRCSPSRCWGSSRCGAGSAWCSSSTRG